MPTAGIGFSCIEVALLKIDIHMTKCVPPVQGEMFGKFFTRMNYIDKKTFTESSKQKGNEHSTFSSFIVDHKTITN